MNNVKDIISFERESYKALCEEMTELLTLEKEIEAKKAELREKLIEKAGGERMEYGIKLQWKTAMGAIDYSKLVKNMGIEEALLEFYRKPDREYWEIRKY